MKNLHLVFLICIFLFYSKNEILNFLNNENMKNIEDDDNPMKSDYSNLIKTTKQIGFTKDGSISGFTKNAKKIKKIINGIMTDQTQVVKSSRPIGNKLVYDTGFKCKDSSGNEHPQHIYINNVGNRDLGLSTEVGNALGKIAGGALKGIKSAFKGSVDSTCSKATLKTISNSGKDGTATVYIQNSELSDISPDNIVEGYSNINNLLADDKLFYKNFIIFTYLFGLSLLFLFLLFKLIINSN